MKTKFESHHLIRDTDGTGETDYGMMSVYEIGGIRNAQSATITVLQKTKATPTTN